ncbi:NAD-dependent epimerase/dehydratase family protein [Micromonospora sp. RHAY321]|uniref:NAD-dependent epimerase/dehydratase family protein n=1 Tax=Micromonospora sp. RHAY321 TaxID=2944807 RepID=UPI00207D1557|nr:NAD-dependent epimerase/dehydratase family protein [Micromonospora sp. RHAY321]MCO1597783.1 NAD-dependent epimerase/dehydratase family protein [Micromonospora sp. RHAY321]
MRVVIFGATGMVGQGVLRECLLADDVREVLTVGRTPTGQRHPKLRELTVADVGDLDAVRDELTGVDACFYCLGVSSLGLDEATYTTVSYDYPLAAVRLLAEVSPNVTFVYVSGVGTDSTQRGRVMWARVKGRTENAVLDLLPNGYAARPGFIQPTHGAASRTRWYRVLYAVTSPLFPVVSRLFPNQVTSTDRLGRAMLRVARQGSPRRVLAGRDLT